MEPKAIVDYLVGWLKEKTEDAGKKGGVVGLSGGIDSAVVAALCRLAFNEEHLALILPCHTSTEDMEMAQKVTQSLELKTKTIELSDIFDTLFQRFDLSSAHSLAAANIKPRLRMIALYALAQEKNYLVIGTTNLSEWEIGYFTKYGDGASDVEPIANLLKTEVREVARYLKIPAEIINRPPSAGLWTGQTDEKELGFSYEELDHFLLTGKTKNKETKDKILKLKAASLHKKSLPPAAARFKELPPLKEFFLA